MYDRHHLSNSIVLAAFLAEIIMLVNRSGKPVYIILNVHNEKKIIGNLIKYFYKMFIFLNGFCVLVSIS